MASHRANTNRVKFEEQHVFTAAVQGPSLPWDEWTKSNDNDDASSWGDEPQTPSNIYGIDSNVFEVLNFLTDEEFQEKDYSSPTPNPTPATVVFTSDQSVSEITEQAEIMFERTREIARKHIIEDLKRSTGGVAFDSTHTHPRCGITWEYDGTGFDGLPTRRTVWNNQEDWFLAYQRTGMDRSWELQNPLLLDLYLPYPDARKELPTCFKTEGDESDDDKYEIHWIPYATI